MAWAVSSVGRALHLQCRGQRFESATVHQIDLVFTLSDENGAGATALSRGRLDRQWAGTGDRIRYGPPDKNRVFGRLKIFFAKNLLGKKLPIRF